MRSKETITIFHAANGHRPEFCLSYRHSCPNHLDALLMKLREAGVEMQVEKERIHLNAVSRLKGIDIRTLPYPGFPTDMQAQMVALMTAADLC